MKKPLVPWTCGSVSRNSGRFGCGTAATRRRGLDLEAGGVDDRLVLVGVDRADRVDDRAARAARARPRRAAARAGAPAAAVARQRRSGRAGEHAEARARRVDERAVEARQLGGARARRRARRGRSSRRGGARSPRAPARGLVQLDGDDLAGEHRRLAARAPRRGRARARPPASRRTRPASCEPRLCGQIRPRRAPPRRRARRDTRPGRRSARRRSRRGRAGRPSRRLVLRAHQRERVSSPEVAPPDLGDPVRVGVLQRARRERRRPATAKPSASRRMTAFVNGTARSRPRGAHELDRLVDGRVRAETRLQASWYAPIRSAATTGGSSLRTGRRPSVSIPWSSVRTRCTVPYAIRCASARSRASSSSAAAANARSA